MKIIFFSILGISLLVLGYFMVQVANPTERNETIPTNTGANVTIVDGKQIVEIDAKGGYTPRVSLVKPGIPTVIRFNTRGTFDCSSVVSIPSKNVNQVLPSSGATEINLGTLEVGTLEGSCGMGMYPFELRAVNE